MKIFQFESLYDGKEWRDNVYCSVDTTGKIKNISDTLPTGIYDREKVSGWTIPGFINGHSHAFQWAIAGTTESIALHRKQDDFWSWREAMYQTALSITPEHMEKIATTLYKEMLAQGYTSVVEFHYLHHDIQGKPYAQPAEMGIRLIEAAKKAGIAITIIPVLYQQCDLRTPAKSEQRRFISKTIDAYWQLYEDTAAACSNYSRARIGVGIHSIRAVPPTAIAQLCGAIDSKTPIHMHIAEQMVEVRQCEEILGQRPVHWLLSHLAVDKRYNLIHATHINSDESKNLAKSGANVVICPSTEGNLGDGFFPLLDYMQHQGSFSIGSDSHIGLSPLEELRWLDYGQRLLSQKRNPLCLQQPGNSGQLLYEKISAGGQNSIGEWERKHLSTASFLDCIVFNNKHPRLEYISPENRLAALIYCGDRSMISGILTSGRWVKDISFNSASAEKQT